MKAYDDDQMLMLSGIQHFMYCPRQWALIHIDQQWNDNRLTAEGQILHKNVDNPAYRQKNGDTITLRSVHIASRLRKVAKECINYGQRVQNSVFECLLTEAQFVGLKATLASLINDTTDSIRFYFLGNNWQSRIEQIGKQTSFDPTDTLII